jgi:transcriptional regulator GlxA family with amidase domain
MKRIVLAAALMLTLTATAATKPRNVAIFLYEGAEILDFAGPSEVLEASSHNLDAGAMNVFTVARTKDPITAQRFVKVVPNYSIADAPKIDVLVIPGGNSEPTTRDPEVMEWIHKTVENAEVTLTVCTGAFPLAKLGYFDGRDVTTFYGAIDGLRKAAPKANVQDGRRYVDNGKFITTAGVSAGIDGALHLVARLYGRRIADQTAQYMEYHWTPEPYLARGYQYLNPSTDDEGRLLQTALMYSDENNTRGALETYRRIVDRSPGNAEAWYQLGRTLQLSGDQQSAITAYEHALTDGAAKRNTLYNLACAYGVLKQKDRAMAYLEQAVAAGFPKDYALVDPDLEILRQEPRYAALAK